MTSEMHEDMVKRVKEYLIGGRWRYCHPINQNVSKFGLKCLADLVEKREITMDAIRGAGGHELTRAVGKLVTVVEIHDVDGFFSPDAVESIRLAMVSQIKKEEAESN